MHQRGNNYRVITSDSGQDTGEERGFAVMGAVESGSSPVSQVSDKKERKEEAENGQRSSSQRTTCGDWFFSSLGWIEEAVRDVLG